MPTNTSWCGDRRSFPTAVRAAILRRDPICRACGVSPSTIADHIVNVAKARREGWPDALIDGEHNGQGLCERCHDEKTKRERLEGIAARGTRKRKPEAHPGLL